MLKAVSEFLRASDFWGDSLDSLTAPVAVQVLHLSPSELLADSTKPDPCLFEVGQGYCALHAVDGESGNVDRLWDFLKVTLGIGPQASSLLLHPLQLQGEGEVVEIGFSSAPSLFPARLLSFQFIHLARCQGRIPAMFIWPNVF